MAVIKHIKNILPIPKEWENNNSLRQFGLRINDAIRELFGRRVAVIKLNGSSISTDENDIAELLYIARGNHIANLQTDDKASSNIAKGTYIFWKNRLYIASTAISSGTTLSTSTNLTQVTGGAMNELKPKEATVQNASTNANGMVSTTLSTDNIVIVAAWLSNLTYAVTPVRNASNGNYAFFVQGGSGAVASSDVGTIRYFYHER